MGTQKNVENNTKRKSLKRRSFVKYMLGSVVLFIAACASVPIAMEKITGLLYKFALKIRKDEDDDWETVIERKDFSKTSDTEESD